MIQKQTYLKVADNSGAQELMCFHLIGSTGKRFARLGDKIICSVKRAIANAQVKKGDIVTAVIVRTRKEFKRKDGSYIRFGDNAAVIIKGGDKDDAMEPVATRIFGPVAREVKDQGYSSIASKAPEVL